MKGKKSGKVKVESAKPAREFFGTTYAYDLGALAGVKEVGVIKTASSGWFVGWWGQKGVSVLLNTARLPCSQNAEELQIQLDDWAEKHGLDPVARIAGGAS
jgi:hypothetical protein